MTAFPGPVFFDDTLSNEATLYVCRGCKFIKLFFPTVGVVPVSEWVLFSKRFDAMASDESAVICCCQDQTFRTHFPKFGGLVSLPIAQGKIYGLHIPGVSAPRDAFSRPSAPKSPNGPSGPQTYEPKQAQGLWDPNKPCVPA